MLIQKRNMVVIIFVLSILSLSLSLSLFLLSILSPFLFSYVSRAHTHTHNGGRVCVLSSSYTHVVLSIHISVGPLAELSLYGRNQVKGNLAKTAQTLHYLQKT